MFMQRVNALERFVDDRVEKHSGDDLRGMMHRVVLHVGENLVEMTAPRSIDIEPALEGSWSELGVDDQGAAPRAHDDVGLHDRKRGRRWIGPRNTVPIDLRS